MPFSNAKGRKGLKSKDFSPSILILGVILINYFMPVDPVILSLTILLHLSAIWGSPARNKLS